MTADPQVPSHRSTLTLLRQRFAALKAGDPESGALSLEWVAIAIVLVTAALALATFLAGKLGALESLIPN